MSKLRSFVLRGGGKGLVLQMDPQDDPPECIRDGWNVVIDQPVNTISRRATFERYSPTADRVGGESPYLGLMGNNSFDHSAEVVMLAPWIRRDGTRLLVAIVRTGNDTDARLYWNKPDDNALFTEAMDIGEEPAPATFSVSGEYPPTFAVYNDLMYIATGSDDARSNIVFDGTHVLTHAGLNAPTGALTVTDGNEGHVPAGSHSWLYTFYDTRTGTESLPSPATAFTAAGDKCASFDDADELDASADRYRLYRTAVDQTVYQLVGEFETLGTDTDNISDDELGYDAPPAAGGAPFTCRFNLAHKGRVLWGGKTDPTGQEEPNLIWVSEPGHPLSVDPLSAVAVERDDGDELMGGVVLLEQVFVFKRRRMYRLVEDVDLLYRIEPCMRLGTPSPATVVTFRNRLLFLSEDGIIMSTGCSVDNVADQMLHEVFHQPTDAQIIRFAYTNETEAGQTMQFRVSFYSDAEKESLVLARTSETGAWTLDSSAATAFASGVDVAAGQTVRMTLDARAELSAGCTYYVTIEASADGGATWGDAMDYYSTGYVPDIAFAFETSINWGVAEKFFAVHRPQASEYWCFVASNDSQKIDTAWVLNYQTGALVRHSLMAASGCVYSDDDDRQKLLLADYDGVVWQESNGGQIERDLGDGQTLVRNGRGDLGGTTGSWILTDNTAAWPTGGTATKGLRGGQVVLVDALGIRYTGIIQDTLSSTQIVISTFLQGRVPPPGAVDYYIGGMDAYFRTPWLDLEDGVHAKQVKALDGHVESTGDGVTIDLFAADSPSELTLANSVTWRRSRVAMAADARGPLRAPISGRGRFIALAIGSVSAGRAFCVQSYGVRFLPTGGTR